MLSNFASLFLLVSIGGFVVGSKIKAYHFNKRLKINQMNRDDTVRPDCLYHRGNISVPSNFTVCHRWSGFQYTTPREVLYLMTMGNMDENLTDFEEGFIFGGWHSGPWLGYKLRGESNQWIGYQETDWELQKWTHTCLSVSMVTGSYKLVENGKLIFEKIVPGLVNLSMHLTPTFNFLSVGCHVRNNLYKFASMHGRATDVQAWKALLDTKTMMDITRCRNTQKRGNLFSWQTTEWTFATPRNLSEIEEWSQEEVCRSTENSFIFLPYRTTFKYAYEVLCDQFSGRIAGYNSQSEFLAMQEYLSKKKYYKNAQCMFMIDGTSYNMIHWLGFKDDNQEGFFVNVYSNRTPDFQPWEENRPMFDGRSYNCLLMSLTSVFSNEAPLNVKKAVIRDDDCKHERCTLCEIPRAARRLQIRGLCKKSIFDTSYIYTVSDDGKPMYVGKSSSAIWFNSEKQHWIWVDRKDENVVAISDSGLDQFFLGMNAVKFNSSSDLCVQGKSTKKIEIKLTACLMGDQFTCDNGQCISMDKRCDQTINCVDGSDESNCKMLKMNNNYNSRIPPFIFDSKNDRTIPTEVSITMTVLSIINIAEVNHGFTLKFVFGMEWYDHRLKYQNLKKRRSNNALTYEEIKNIWIPHLIFGNTKASEATLGKRSTELTITREGNFTRSDLQVIEEINVFEGKENKLTFEMTYTKEFECEYQLMMYPFDTQTCTVDVIGKKLERQLIVLLPKEIQMNAKVTLTQYDVISWEMKYRNAFDYSQGVQMSFRLKRRVVNEIMTSFLPATIILIIVYCTNYFKLSHFNTALTINLTSLLVLTTLFIGVSNSLPKVAYIKG